MHHFDFSKQPPQDVSEGGYRIRATKSNFPALQNMSLYQLVLKPKAVREPHWHANADELGYCLQGKVLISFYANGNHKEQFMIAPGETFLIPSGALHSLENIGEETASLILQFSHEEPEDFGLSSTFGMFSDAVLGNTWHASQQEFQPLKRSIKETFIATLNNVSSVPSSVHYGSPYQFNLEGSFPLVANEGGAARVARKNVWPILDRQAVYSLQLTGTGMREPHWHPETAELGYVLSPNGQVDTYLMETGDIYFIPKAYPHHIENLDISSNLEVIIFFDQPMPQDIGFTGSVKSNSDEVLAAVLHTTPEFFNKLPTYYEDLFIVDKLNP
jgi:oxalate decarboxylase